MNRYPLWKNILVVVTLVLGMLYTLPNFYGEAPAVQISSVKATVKIDDPLLAQVKATLKAIGVVDDGIFVDPNSIRVRLKDGDTQLKAQDALEKALNPDPNDASYSIAPNLLSRSPLWLTGIHALPMYLGLDLRGGVYFLLQVDMKEALKKRFDSAANDLRTLLRDKDIRHSGIDHVGNTLVIKFNDAATRDKALNVVADSQPDFTFAASPDSNDFDLIGNFKPAAELRIEDYAIKQNIATLHNRINELGVSEPVIQQQGADRIVVELPGVQDTAKAKDILGRTASLEVRMVDDEDSANPEIMAQAASGQPPPGTKLYTERGGAPLLVKDRVVLTGDRLIDAQAGFDQNHEPSVNLTLDSAGARIFKDITRDNVGKRMAILLIEKGKGEVVTAPVIRTEIDGGRVQITGRMTVSEASDVALLLRAGSLAAPMEIIQERTIGPSLGADNIRKGFHSTLWGFAAISVFMSLYYLLFGLVSVLALSSNVMLLFALLSMLQATLTLPGIAAIALTLGMAIDSNVLINERIREELRNGESPQAAIRAGYDRAWSTIIDSNVTTLIAGVALLIFGSGPVRGFAVVHVLGILTSLFSSVVVSRGIINLIYGSRRRVDKLSIGQVWRPGIKTK
ncbi:MAG TPA: protein translocase subunit SecD [Rhodocyclaceae bacterium]|nr:protein translocase subunit SecD [Rhodocyclaceae bacterium]